MKADFPALWAESPSTLRREPTPAEMAGGFPCGDLDLPLFNELFYRLAQIYRETTTAIAQSGQTPSASILNQMSQAMRRPLFALDTGTPNHLVLSIPGWDGREGCIVTARVGAGNTNTGATDIAIGGTAALPITYTDGSALLPGELTAGREFAFLTTPTGAVLASPPVKLTSSIYNSVYQQFYTTPLTYWRMDSPSITVPAGSLTILSNYANKTATFNAGTNINQSDGQVTIGPNDGGTYVLSATNAMDQPTLEESIYIFRNGSAIATSRSALNAPDSNAMDKSVTCVQRLVPGDVVSAVYFQQNSSNAARQSLNQALGHFGGVRVGG